MGAVPDDVEFDAIVKALRETEGVKDLHHVHIWSLDEHERALEAHLVPAVASLEAFERVKIQARAMLRERFSIGHATLEACLDEQGGDQAAASHGHPK